MIYIGNVLNHSVANVITDCDALGELIVLIRIWSAHLVWKVEVTCVKDTVMNMYVKLIVQLDNIYVPVCVNNMNVEAVLLDNLCVAINVKPMNVTLPLAIVQRAHINAMTYVKIDLVMSPRP